MTDNSSQTKVLPDGPAGELPPGAELNSGMYRITRRIDAGGFGITYEALDNLDRKIAIKECFPAGLALRSGDFTVSAASASTSEPFETARNLFLREARTLAVLRHPNIVHVQTLFEENGTAYMAMDYIDGRDLQEVIDRTPELLTPTYVLELTRTLLGAMEYLHSENPSARKEALLHRDIKPANIRIDERNTPVIIDFGAARQESKNRSRAAGTFRVVSDGYSPSEFYVAGAEQSPASDLYSLAATLHHCIAGVKPPPADERAHKVQNGAEDPYEPIAGRFPGHDPRLLALIDRALQRPLKDRPADAAAWFSSIPDAGTRILPVDEDDLQTVYGEPFPEDDTPPPPAPPPPAPAKRGGGMVLGAVLGAAVIAALGGGAMALGLLPMPTPETDEELRERLEQTETVVLQLETDLETRTEELAALQADVERTTTARNQALSRADELSETVERLRSQVSELTEGDGPDATALRAELDTALAEQTRLTAEIATLNTALAEAEAGADAAAAAQIAALEAQIEALGDDGDVTALMAELDAALAARDAALDLAERAQSDLARMASNLDEAESEAARLLMELRQSEQRLSRMLAGDVTPAPAPIQPNSASSCPSISGSHAAFDYSGTEIYTPRTHDDAAGGSIDVTGCTVLPVNRTGFVGVFPDFTFNLTGMSQFGRLEISATSAANCPVTLLAQSVDGAWHFDADSNGAGLPRLELTDVAAADGPLYVWMGTPDGSACSATLHINTWLF